MSKKLSEIKDDEMLLVDGIVIDKESLLYDWKDYKGKEIWTTKQYKASVSANYMLRSALEHEDQNMYEGWFEGVSEDVTKEDIEELQTILNRILSGSRNISYTKDEKVEIDIVTKEDIEELQTISNRTLSGSRNISYTKEEKVEIDIKHC